MRTFRDWLAYHGEHFPGVRRFREKRQQQWHSWLRCCSLADLTRCTDELARRQAAGWSVPDLHRQPGWMLREVGQAAAVRLQELPDCDLCQRTGLARVCRPDRPGYTMAVACSCQAGDLFRESNVSLQPWMRTA